MVKECLEEDEKEKVVVGSDETDQMMERKYVVCLEHEF